MIQSKEKTVIFLDFAGTLVKTTKDGLYPFKHTGQLLALGDQFHLGVLCNTGIQYTRDNIEDILEEFGGEGRIDPNLIILPSKMGFPLPDRRAFRIAAAIAECELGKCVYVTSNLQFRTAAAISGMQAVTPTDHEITGTGTLPDSETAIDVVPEAGLLADIEVSAPLLLHDGPVEDAGLSVILKGRVVTMNQEKKVLENGRVVVHKGKIEAVLTSEEDVPDEFKAFKEMNTSGTIYPGLIDLHNHFVYNVLPLWEVPKRFDNRSQWPRQSMYKSDVSMPIKKALGKYTLTSEALVRYVEAKALIGGTTTGQGMLTRVSGGASLFRGAMRNVERPGHPELPKAGTRVPNLYPSDDRVEAFRKALTKPGRAAYFYHLSEGTDDRARRHFFNLLENELILETLVGIHALALEPEDLNIMGEQKASIVWSPFSNLLLYGKTLDLAGLKSSGVLFSLGCDWTPTGSKNLLHELKVAAFENNRQGSPFSNFQLVASVTAHAAKVAGWHKSLGSIGKGKMADFLVISGDDGDPYEHLIKATERDVNLVMVHGIPRCGTLSLMDSLHKEWGRQGSTVPEGSPLESIGINGTSKAMQFFAPTSPINHVSFSRAREILNDAMGDLYGFVDRMEELKADLTALGNESPERFTLVLDNEFHSEEDPFQEFDESFDMDLLADVKMAESVELDGAFVHKESYVQKLNGQSNISMDLVEYLTDLY